MTVELTSALPKAANLEEKDLSQETARLGTALNLRCCNYLLLSALTNLLFQVRNL